ncbi:CHAD domain-containing protein [Rhizobiaceae bacterium BDR2-2]|uniref:CHAD domain-containing protein n=1 Tax=Ectorhizobium quercum TaxID=2965071 RepID=A0AAE3SUN5_9HYPH|nr:CHAD domain-containing protein [Ectorhizobium quercum]MCX8996878.1 CHAD domain-containing protein [Ectorhizobium quercum]
MALRLDPATLSGARLRSGAREAFENAVALLSGQPEGPHHAVHETRKTLKRMRALYRLVAHRNKADLSRENARLRDIARRLARGREAAALAETARWLVAQARSADETALLTRTAAALEARRDSLTGQDTEADIAAAIEALAGAIEGTAVLSLPDSRKKTARLIARNWQRAMQKGRRALSPLTVDSPAEAFHELRKATQTANAYHTLLKPLWPQALTARQDRLRDLIDTLGRENDLAGIVLLMEKEPQHFGEAIEQVIQQRVLARRREALRLSALQQAAKVFAADPKEDAEPIEILWNGLGN